MLREIARGKTNREISGSLVISERTVSRHITNIYAKLEVENRGQMIVMARQAGFGRGA